MARQLSYPRARFRSRLRAWLTTNRTRIAIVVAVVAALLVFETVVVLGLFHTSAAARWYYLGFLHAAILAIAGSGLVLAFLAHDKQALLLMRGAWGEDNTRDELKRAKRQGLIWGWVDSVPLRLGDIDHLVITRTGGVIVIDSKWRTSTSLQDHEDMARAIAKVQLRSEALVRQLMKRGRGKHRDATKFHRVTPLLVVWGAEQDSVPDDFRIDEIEVIGGPRLVEWLRTQSGDIVDKASADDLIGLIENFREGAMQSLAKVNARRPAS